MVNVGTLFAFVLVSAGVIILRRVACVWLMLNLTGLTWIRFGIWMLVGVAVYVLYGRSHSLQGRRQADEVSGAT
jgi:APA family basic amino acid/polyamine antiporter